MNECCDLCDVVFDDIKLKLAQGKHETKNEKEFLMKTGIQLRDLCPDSHEFKYNHKKGKILDKSRALIEKTSKSFDKRKRMSYKGKHPKNKNFNYNVNKKQQFQNKSNSERITSKERSSFSRNRSNQERRPDYRNGSNSNKTYSQERRPDYRNRSDSKISSQERADYRNRSDSKIRSQERTHYSNRSDSKISSQEKTHYRNRSDSNKTCSQERKPDYRNKSYGQGRESGESGSKFTKNNYEKKYQHKFKENAKNHGKDSDLVLKSTEEAVNKWQPGCRGDPKGPVEQQWFKSRSKSSSGVFRYSSKSPLSRVPENSNSNSYGNRSYSLNSWNRSHDEKYYQRSEMQKRSNDSFRSQSLDQPNRYDFKNSGTSSFSASGIQNYSSRSQPASRDSSLESLCSILYPKFKSKDISRDLSTNEA